MIDIITLVVSELATNCYIVTDSKTGDCAVIDPGEFTKELDEELSKIGYDKVRYVLLTHGHCDHIAGTNSIIEKTGSKAKTAISGEDTKLLNDSYLNLSCFFCDEPVGDIKADIELHDGDIIKLGDSEFKVLSTPGHTAGSVCFICDNTIFSGDTLFYHSQGRTDFPTSSPSDMARSLARIAALDGDYNILTGHDIPTTLDNERKFNPYIGSVFYDNIY